MGRLLRSTNAHGTFLRPWYG